MARKKINDPQFSLGNVLPEGVVNDFDIFYKPQVAPQNKEVASLISSLSNIVPTLANYDVIEQAELKGENEAKAVEDYNVNKEAFASLVKSKKMPAGANPHYFNKMMELDLASKARDFQRKFDDYYASNLSDATDQDIFKGIYQDELKTFYKENNLNKYDPLALNKAFFSTTSKYRDDKEFTHNTNRLAKIEEQTKELEVRNYAGSFIDFQSKGTSIDDVHAFIKKETNEYIDLTKNPYEANELFLTGLKTYVSAVNTPDGFEYAKKLVDSLDTLKLGTGEFSGSSRASFYKKTMENDILTKQIAHYQREEQFNKINNDRDTQKITDEYYLALENPEFEINNFLGTLDGDSSLANDKYNGKQKTFLQQLHNSNQAATRVTFSQPNAIEELDKLKIDDPYSVRNRALELMNAGELTSTDFERFSNAAGNYDILTKNTFFRQSRVFNNLKDFFDDPSLAQIPSMRTEIPLLKNDFELKIIQYWNEIKDLNISNREKQKKLDGEVKLLIGEVLLNSRIFSKASGLLKDITNRYGITLPASDADKAAAKEDLPSIPE
jgi:hypothetical protein